MRLLLIEDEHKVSELVARALRAERYAVDVAEDGERGWELAQTYEYDLIILDLMLPRLSGAELLRRVRRKNQQVPILILTARDATEEKVHGLTIGGDDYVTKPFSIEELVARIRVVLRRHHPNGATESGKLVLHDLELDDETHEVFRAGEPVELTRTEFRLLRYLMMNSGRVLSRTQILDHVWDYDFGGDASVLETYISYLRRKVDQAEPALIHTVRGVGYVMRVPRTTPAKA